MIYDYTTISNKINSYLESGYESKTNNEYPHEDYTKLCNFLNKYKKDNYCFNMAFDLIAYQYDTDAAVSVYLFPNNLKNHPFVQFLISDETDFETFLSQTKTKKENPTTMKNSLLDFGPMNNVRLSPYGIAFLTNNDTWVAFNAENEQSIDVTEATFNVEGLIYKVPCAITQIKKGDFILYSGQPLYVRLYDKDSNTLDCIDVHSSEVKTIKPMKNMFNFDFVAKIVNFASNFMTTTTPSPENPFGNIMPMLMMQSFFNKDDNNSINFSKFAMLSMFNGIGGINNADQ